MKTLTLAVALALFGAGGCVSWTPVHDSAERKETDAKIQVMPVLGYVLDLAWLPFNAVGHLFHWDFHQEPEKTKP